MQLSVITPGGVLLSTEIEKIFLPGTLGAFELLRGHAPLISSLTAGVVRYANSEGEENFVISGGFVRVADDVVELCVELPKDAAK